MQLSIIIVNWNVREYLSRCLDSIFFHFEDRGFEIIVVDNASQDGSVEMIRKEFPQVKLIANDDNYGFAKACNQGIVAAQGNFLFFLNPDTKLGSNTCNQIITFMESHPEVGVGGCHLYYPDGKMQTSFYKFTSLPNHLGRALLFHSFFPKNHFTAPFFRDYLKANETIDRVCGGAMVVRQEALQEVGLFDESLFMYYEDEDLCYRMRQKGWKIAPIPGTRIIHYHDQSGKRNIRKAIFSSYKSQFLFYRKYNSNYKALIFRVIQLLGVAIRSFFWFFKIITGKNQEVAKQKLVVYLSILLSDFSYRRSLIK